jgi:integrase/recombinase XerD
MSVLLELLEHAELAPRTKRAYRRCLERWLAFAGPDPAGWNPHRVAAWRESLRTELGPATVNKHLYALRRVAKMYEGYEHGRDFARAVEGVHNPGGAKRTALTVSEVRAMITTCAASRPRDLRDRCAITLGVRTGLRASELVGINWGGIAGREAAVSVKGRKPHRVILDDECLRALGAWAAWLEGQGYARRGPVLRGVSQEGVDGRFRVTTRMSRQKLHDALRERGAEAGIRRPVYPHLLRHTFVTWGVASGVPLARIMVQTGHKSLATLSKYVSDLEASSDPVGAYLPSLEEDDDDD